ncbi:hypothetical protein M405DRAFT_880566 [Rhizopogon salebrosus TDB-379]|nr:hypothetical protein M405DRAFT_880566 [Rhizopogon salebrosus TDB-379]
MTTYILESLVAQIKISTTLLRLPPELLCHILVYLDDGYDLMRVRQTCKALKALVVDSEELQYVIDLCYFRMTHVGTHETDVSLTMHRRRLRQHKDAWQRFEYKTKCTLQPVSAIRVVDGPDDGSHAFDIHLRSLATNEIHPDAARSILRAFENKRGSNIPEKLQIVRNYVIMQCQDPMGESTSVQMWDWKCREGYEFLISFYEDAADYCFIAEDRFLILTEGTMIIYSITNKSKPPQCTARLSLPSLMDGWVYEEVSTSINPSPGFVLPDFQESSHQPSCLFHPSADDQLVVIRIFVGANYEQDSFVFCARRSAIQQIESLFAKIYAKATLNDSSSPRSLSWAMWGPQNTSWFQGELLRWPQSLYGFRTVGSTSGDSGFWGPRRLCIRDFNLHVACNYGAEDAAERRSRLVQGELTTTISRPFIESLGSTLSYREIVSEELFDVTETMMDESRILLLNPSDMDRSSSSRDLSNSKLWFGSYEAGYIHSDAGGDRVSIALLGSAPVDATTVKKWWYNTQTGFARCACNTEHCFTPLYELMHVRHTRTRRSSSSPERTGEQLWITPPLLWAHLDEDGNDVSVCLANAINVAGGRSNTANHIMTTMYTIADEGSR